MAGEKMNLPDAIQAVKQLKQFFRSFGKIADVLDTAVQAEQATRENKQLIDRQRVEIEGLKKDTEAATKEKAVVFDQCEKAVNVIAEKKAAAEADLDRTMKILVDSHKKNRATLEEATKAKELDLRERIAMLQADFMTLEGRKLALQGSLNELRKQAQKAAG